MHESRLVTDLINEAVRIAVANNSEDIRRVDVHIGALSHVTPLSLESLLAEAASGTVVSEATFSITKSTATSSDDALDIRLVSMTIGDH